MKALLPSFGSLLLPFSRALGRGHFQGDWASWGISAPWIPPLFSCFSIFTCSLPNRDISEGAGHGRINNMKQPKEKSNWYMWPCPLSCQAYHHHHPPPHPQIMLLEIERKCAGNQDGRLKFLHFAGNK